MSTYGNSRCHAPCNMAFNTKLPEPGAAQQLPTRKRRSYPCKRFAGEKLLTGRTQVQVSGALRLRQLARLRHGVAKNRIGLIACASRCAGIPESGVRFAGECQQLGTDDAALGGVFLLFA